MRAMFKLLPCPFCGSNNLKLKNSTMWGWFVSCSCAAVGPSSKSKDEAIVAWNTRTEAKQPTLDDAWFERERSIGKTWEVPRVCR